jgi:hypothetical protein
MAKMELSSHSVADVKSIGPNPGETEVLRAADPKEGMRLVRAFLRINDPSVRRKIIDVVEQAWADPISGELAVLSSIVRRASAIDRMRSARSAG